MDLRASGSIMTLASIMRWTSFPSVDGTQRVEDHFIGVREGTGLPGRVCVFEARHDAEDPLVAPQ